MAVNIKRIYAPVLKEDGYRILIDGLWPRGITKEHAHIDIWLKEIAPSAALRKWFGHEADKWEEFCKRYKAELKDSEALEEILKLTKAHKTTTLLYAAKDEQHNNAMALLQLMKS